MEELNRDMGEVLSAIKVAIKDIASQQADAFDFISNLRKYFVREDLNLVNLSPGTKPEEITILYFLDTVLSDIWLNLSTDASFEFPWDDTDMQVVSKNLRDVTLLITDGKPDFAVAAKHLCQAIYHYHLCLNKLEKQLLNEGTRRREIRK